MEKQKSWFRRHWIISIFLGMFLLGIISIYSDSGENENISQEDTNADSFNEESSEINTPLEVCTPNWQCGDWSECNSPGTQTRTCTDTNNCGTNSDKPETSQSCVLEPDLEMSMIEIFHLFSGLSELQQEEKIKELKGKRIKTSTPVYKIDKVPFSTQYVIMDSEYAPSVKAFFPSEEKDKLLNVNLGDTIVFSGEFVTYHEGYSIIYVEFTKSKFIELG